MSLSVPGDSIYRALQCAARCSMRVCEVAAQYISTVGRTFYYGVRDGW